ncbi:MAG: hypothetical protein ACK4ND_02870 [Cytophagaceae bacterium]
MKSLVGVFVFFMAFVVIPVQGQELPNVPETTENLGVTERDIEGFVEGSGAFNDTPQNPELMEEDQLLRDRDVHHEFPSRFDQPEELFKEEDC